MGFRITPGEVQAIIDTDVSEFEPFIQAAENVVTAIVVPAGSLSDIELKEIERWLAAHFVAIKDQDAGMIRELQVGQTIHRYGSQLGKGLEATWYGQQALALDSTLALSTVGQKQAEFRVVTDI